MNAAELEAAVLKIGPPVAPVRVIETPFAMDRRQVRFPRSKKKRIRNKWAKDRRNWITAEAAYRIVTKDPDTVSLVLHPSLAAKLREAMKRQAEADEMKADRVLYGRASSL